ncbi:MAG TPA: hypothetical protein VF517_17230 [Thermoleophilaceae bacterium]|jgi:hypothetical protein
MATFDVLGALPVTVDSCRFEHLRQVVATRRFERVTTLVRLGGGGHEGIGEDVSLNAPDHDGLPDADALPVGGGPRPLREWLAALTPDAMWSSPPATDTGKRSRQWAFESAALDLALRQAGLSLAAALEREPRPVRFVASFRLGEPPTLDPVRIRLDRYPALRLKLDPTTEWDESIFTSLADLDVVDVVDLKGAYKGTMVDQPADPRMYERALAAFPRSLIEDPGLTPETEPILAPHRERVSWDAPIIGADDVRALDGRPAGINVKPSRIGSLERLCGVYDHCRAEAIPMYGGGMFELGPGRRQIQALAALFHPDGPNDVAPSGYNEPEPPPGLPVSPLPVALDAPGLGAEPPPGGALQ